MDKAKFKLSFVVFNGLLALFLSIVYYLLRYGFEDSVGNSMASLISVLGVSLFILFSSENLVMILRIRNVTTISTWLTCDSFITLCALVIVIGAGLLARFTEINILIIFTAVGFISLAMHIIRLLKITDIKKIILPAGILSLLALWITGMVYSDPLNPLYFESMFIAAVNKDTVFHVLLTSIIQTYHIPSIALDGIKFIPYHFGSHAVLAQFSSLLKIPPITSLQMVVPIVFVPLFLYSFFLLALDIQAVFNNHSERIGRKNKLYFLFLLVVSQVGFVPFYLLDAFTPGNQNIATISNTFSMITSFLFISILLNAKWSFNNEKISDKILMLFILPIMIAFISVSKISSGVMVLVILAFAFLRFKLYKKVLFVISFALTLLSFLLVYTVCFTSAIAPKFYDFSFSPLEFYKELVNILPIHHAVYFFFPVVNYATAFIFIYLRLKREGVKSFGDLKERWLKNSIVDVEIILLLVIIGSISILFFSLPQVQHYWFLDFSYWIAAAAVLSLLLSPTPVSFISTGTDHSQRKMFIKKTLLWSTWCIISISILYNVGLAAIRGVGFNIRNRSMMITEVNPTILPLDTLLSSLKKVNLTKTFSTLRLLFSSYPQLELKKHKDFKMISALEKLSTLPQHEKENSLMFVPQSDSLYWNFLHKSKVSGRIISFIAGGISGIGLLDGMPPVGALDWKFTGFSSYKERTVPQKQAECRIDTLCGKIQAKGFSQLILINSYDGQIKIVNCNDYFTRHN